MSFNCRDCQKIHNTAMAERAVYETKLAAKDAEIAKLREALEGCYELTYRPITLTTHLNKALEAGQ